MLASGAAADEGLDVIVHALPKEGKANVGQGVEETRMFSEPSVVHLHHHQVAKVRGGSQAKPVIIY